MVDMVDYVEPLKRDFEPNLHILFVEINNFSLENIPESVSKHSNEIVESLKIENNKTDLSKNKQLVVPRGDNYKQRIRNYKLEI